MKKMKIRVAENFELGIDYVTSTNAILAKKRAGKTYLAQKIAEGLLAAQQQIVAIDVTGVWWGLRSSASGTAPGYPITIFGGRHGDVPLEATAGEVLAEAIVRDRFSAVLDVRLLKKGQRLRFIADFLEALYDKNTEAMHLFMDEADAYVPQKTFSPEQARALGAADELVRRGGSGGIGVTMISQRSQVVNKDVLSQVDSISVLRMNHPKDIAAIEDWVVNHVDRLRVEKMLASLPSLPIGEAWTWVPARYTFERIQVLPKETYDSGRTPKPGERLRPPKVLAPVDLERLGHSIAATVEAARANDPKVLRAELARAKAELAKKIAPALAVPKTKEVPVIKDAQLARVEKIVERANAVIERAQGTFGAALARAEQAVDDLRKAIKPAITGVDAAARAVRGPQLALPVIEKPSPTPAVTSAELKHVERAMLVALAQHPGGLTRKQVLIFTGYRHSGTTTTAFARILERGFAEARLGVLFATSAGLEAIGDYDPLPTGDALRAKLLNGGDDLSQMEKEILRRVCEGYPDVVDRTTARGDYKHSGSTTTAFARLIAMNYVTKARGGVRAAEELFG